MIRKIVLLVVGVLFTAAVQAMPAFPVKKKVTLPNGEVVELTATGDEFFHYWKGSNGRPFRMLPLGGYEEIPAEEFAQLNDRGISERNATNVERARRMKHRTLGTITSGLKGTKRGLVILVEFPNKKFSVVNNPRTFWYRMFNEKGFNEYAFKGSVRDYFLEQSYGQFTVDFDVVGPYTMKYANTYYGSNSGSSGSHDVNAQAMAWEAMQAANADVNFKDYDWDGDGQVEQVYIIYAGYGENYYGNNEKYIWAHTSSVSSESGGTKLDGVTLGTYACNCEIQGWESSEGTSNYVVLPEGIGSACHEFSHCLGFPDFYNTQSGESTSMQNWDVLDRGSYNGRSYGTQSMAAVCPAGYTAYERMAAGWLNPVELKDEKRVVGMKPLSEKPEAYILYNERNKNEYFLLENRQYVGFDECLTGHGLLMTHVVFDQTKWNGNSVNTDPTNLGLSLVAADKRNDEYTLMGDPFPGSTGRTSITDKDGILLRTYNADGTYYLHKSIEQITESANGEISFIACRPELKVPQVKAELLSETSFKVSWTGDSRAKDYELELLEFAPKKNPEEALIMAEKFSNCYKSSAGFSDISKSLNQYTDNVGFTGSALYQSPYKLKIGAANKAGYLYSPAFKATSTGSITVVLGVRPDKAAVKGVLEVVMNTRDNVQEDFEFSQEGYLVFHPSILTDDLFRVGLLPESVMYVNYMAVYDGTFSAAELGIVAVNAESSAKEQGGFDEQMQNSRMYAPIHKVNNYEEHTSEWSFTFTDLSPECEYEVRVRAVDEDRQSDWSEPIRVKLSGNTPVLNIMEDEKGSAPDTDYFDLSGRRFGTGSSLRPGIYIKNGKKVLVK